nr:transposase [Alkaliphilus pronyensis]
MEDKEDKEKFLEAILECKDKSEYRIYAYCLMINHIHILLKEGKEDLGMTMRRIGASYIYWYNFKYGRVGNLFQDRYKSEVVEDDQYLFTVLRYIHQNPISAGIVEHLKDYKWSSYCEYTDKARIIDSGFIFKMFNTNRKKTIRELVKFNEEKSDIVCLDVNEKKRIKDDEAIEIIKNTCNVNQCTDIQKLEKERRDNCVKVIKQQGLSTRSIARLTGISRSIVLKV